MRTGLSKVLIAGTRKPGVNRKVMYILGKKVQYKVKRSQKRKTGVPIMAQWKGIRLGTIRLRVRSLLLFSGLRIQLCCELWCRSQRLGSGIAVAVVQAGGYSSDLTPSLGTSICHGYCPKKTKKRKKKKKIYSHFL